jgi:2-polyprenyl-6-methoxyphenol hydroxylase-like FAD-dependent oxidoreductase
MTEHAVVIAGAGPTGMMLAGDLALAGVDVVIVERDAARGARGSRSGGLHARTVEVLDQRGIAERFLAEGQTAQVAGFGGVRLDISDFPTRHNYGLALWQKHFERILAGWVDELGVQVVRECEVTRFTQDDDGVTVELSKGDALRARYLIACDGGRSAIRKHAGIEFAGWAPSIASILAEVAVRDVPEWGIRYDENGTQAIGPLDDGKLAGVVVTERYTGQSAEPTLDELRRAIASVWGTDFGVHSPTLISRFTDATRQAVSYRSARVLLAGDAAHVHYPVGGQGLNLGVQDAVNLGWKLAQVVKGLSSDDLLDTYHTERHPVAARVLQNTMAQTALTRGDDRTRALRETMSELLNMDEPRRRFAAMMSGLDIRYDIGDGHPLTGRRMPDLDVATESGAARVYEFLHDARPVVINFGASRVDLAARGERVRYVEASYDGVWELPVVGEVGAPDAVVIRPDGYVAWAGSSGDRGLNAAVERWFGADLARG